MKVEIHILQSLPPHNVNRSDTGEPKDAYLGGVRRARISSQCWKRAMRDYFGEHHLLTEGERAIRTKTLVNRVGELVTSADPERARLAAARLLAGGRIKTLPEKGLATEYLLFVPSRVVGELAALASEHLEALSAPSAEHPSQADEVKEKGKGAKRQAKNTAKGEVPPDLQEKVERILGDGSRTPELSMFGSMVADAADRNVSAACQVAHALSTHAVEVLFDWYTAKSDDGTDPGAAMVGTTPFTAACYYRYLAVDVDALVRSLGADDPATTQAHRALAAFVRAAALAFPSGKKNSFSAQVLPSFVLVDVRGGGLRQLSNAFESPIRPNGGEFGSIVEASILRLGEQLAAQDAFGGVVNRRELAFALCDPTGTLAPAFMSRVPGALQRMSIDELVEGVVAAAFRP